jgi:L-amino acid N-acyltransferase YncA
VLGFARANSFRSKKAYRWTAEVSVYLAETYRGRGFGKQLYRTLLSELRERGFHLAVAGITLPNPGSEALHKGLGFELVGVFQEVGWKLGAWHGVAQWQLRLGEGPGDPRLLL